MNQNLKDIPSISSQIHYRILSEAERMSQAFKILSEQLQSNSYLNYLNHETYSLMMDLSYQSFQSMFKFIIDQQEGSSSPLTSSDDNKKQVPPQSPLTREVIQQNRLKSNYKKRIASGRICAVKSVNNGAEDIVKGYLVVFKYYNIKLLFGPFIHLKAAQEVRSSFREELFKLQITKMDFMVIIPEFYAKFKLEMGKRYKELSIYRKGCK